MEQLKAELQTKNDQIEGLNRFKDKYNEMKRATMKFKRQFMQKTNRDWFLCLSAPGFSNSLFLSIAEFFPFHAPIFKKIYPIFQFILKHILSIFEDIRKTK